jgi:predicted RecB family nuclease
LSIQWYNEYLKTKDEKIIKRILEYNEDDCKAAMVLKDFLVKQ